MTLSDYFLSPKGRIGRQEYWLGLIAVMAVTLLGSLMLDPDALTGGPGKVRPPSLASTLWGLAFTWPSTAISIKRFNDRDWPRWIGYALGLAMAGFLVANHHGYLLDPDRMGMVEKLIMVSVGIAFVWALVENGFQRGTPGPNIHGPDPLERAES